MEFLITNHLFFTLFFQFWSTPGMWIPPLFTSCCGAGSTIEWQGMQLVYLQVVSFIHWTEHRNKNQHVRWSPSKQRHFSIYVLMCSFSFSSIQASYRTCHSCIHLKISKQFMMCVSFASWNKMSILFHGRTAVSYTWKEKKNILHWVSNYNSSKLSLEKYGCFQS